MAVVVTDLGTWESSSGATAISPAFTVPAQSLIVVLAIENDSGSIAAASVTNGVGGFSPTWNGPFGFAGADTGTISGAIFYAFNAQTSAQTIIYTKGLGSGSAACSAFYASGMLLTDPLSAAFGQAFTANNISIGPQTNVGPTLFVGMAGTQDGSAGVQGAGFANPPGAITTNAAVQIVMAGTKVSSAPATYAPTYTSGASADCFGLLAAFQAVADPPFVPNDWPIYRHWWDRG